VNHIIWFVLILGLKILLFFLNFLELFIVKKSFESRTQINDAYKFIEWTTSFFSLFNCMMLWTFHYWWMCHHKNVSKECVCVYVLCCLLSHIYYCIFRFNTDLFQIKYYNLVSKVYKCIESLLVINIKKKKKNML